MSRSDFGWCGKWSCFILRCKWFEIQSIDLPLRVIILTSDEFRLIGTQAWQHTQAQHRKFWLGGAAPQTPQFLAGGAKPPQTPPLNGRSSHLIEAAKRGRLDQMIFFSAPLTTRAPPGRPAGRPAERPAGRPLTTEIFAWCKVT